LTRSIGAAAVLDTAAETPPIRKSTRNPCTPFSFGAATKIGAVLGGTMLWPPVKSMGQRALKAVALDTTPCLAAAKGEPYTICCRCWRGEYICWFGANMEPK